MILFRSTCMYYVKSKRNIQKRIVLIKGIQRKGLYIVYSNYYLKNSSFSLCGFSVNSRRNLVISNKSLLK